MKSICACLIKNLDAIIENFNYQLKYENGKYNHDYITRIQVIHDIAYDINLENISRLCSAYIDSIAKNPRELKLPIEIDFNYIIIPWRS